MFDRAAILREAHAETRRRFVPSRSLRHGDRWDAEIGAFVPKASYRVIFAGCLWEAWRMAKAIAASAEFEASLPPVPVEIDALADAMRRDAWAEPITAAGNARMAATLAAAAALVERARSGLPCHA